MRENSAVTFAGRNQNKVGGILVYALGSFAMEFYTLCGANARNGRARHGKR